jgi:hypothetical protein
MTVYDTTIGGRRFLVFSGVAMIPVDRIKGIDLNTPNGSATGHSVRIITDDPDEYWVFAYENADAVMRYLNCN